MSESSPNPKVDEILRQETKWREEFSKLRAIARKCPLTEEVKWGQPSYSSDGSNVVLIHGFKEYCALLFFKGALLKDPKGILVQQTANVQSARQVRFTHAREIDALEPTLKAYILEAIEVEKAGLKVASKKPADTPVPDELKEKFAQRPKLKTAFESLTPGRQRAYLLHFSSAKQSKTREARIEKCLPQILAGKGLDDD